MTNLYFSIFPPLLSRLPFSSPPSIILPLPRPKTYVSAHFYRLTDGLICMDFAGYSRAEAGQGRQAERREIHFRFYLFLPYMFSLLPTYAMYHTPQLPPPPPHPSTQLTPISSPLTLHVLHLSLSIPSWKIPLRFSFSFLFLNFFVLGGGGWDPGGRELFIGISRRCIVLL